MDDLITAIAASMQDLDAAAEAAGDEWEGGYQTEAEVLANFLNMRGVILKMTPPQQIRDEVDPFAHADENTVIDLRQFMPKKSLLRGELLLDVFEDHPSVIAQTLRSAMEEGREISKTIGGSHIAPTGVPYQTVIIAGLVDDDEDVMYGLLNAINEYKRYRNGKVYWRVTPSLKKSFDSDLNKRRVELYVRLLIDYRSLNQGVHHD